MNYFLYEYIFQLLHCFKNTWNVNKYWFFLYILCLVFFFFAIDLDKLGSLLQCLCQYFHISLCVYQKGSEACCWLLYWLQENACLPPTPCLSSWLTVCLTLCLSLPLPSSFLLHSLLPLLSSHFIVSSSKWWSTWNTSESNSLRWFCVFVLEICPVAELPSVEILPIQKQISIPDAWIRFQIFNVIFLDIEYS